METFTDQVMGDLLAKSLDTAQLGEAGWRDVGKGPGSIDGKFIKWHGGKATKKHSALRDAAGRKGPNFTFDPLCQLAPAVHSAGAFFRSWLRRTNLWRERTNLSPRGPAASRSHLASRKHRIAMYPVQLVIFAVLILLLGAVLLLALWL